LAFDAGGFNNRGGSLLHSGSGVFGSSMANLGDVGGRLKTPGQLTLEAERPHSSAEPLLMKVSTPVLTSMRYTTPGRLSISVTRVRERAVIDSSAPSSSSW
ncbi:hypothetical protein, partial [Pseudoalteromonas sp. SIMBA_162]|uniref:hypothetical protein n=1 Tax=Pseudoalteromonas sp. SIMBA_162 TaxID=3080867 RepID=UPI003979DD7E